MNSSLLRGILHGWSLLVHVLIYRCTVGFADCVAAVPVPTNEVGNLRKFSEAQGMIAEGMSV